MVLSSFEHGDTDADVGQPVGEPHDSHAPLFLRDVDYGLHNVEGTHHCGDYVFHRPGMCQWMKVMI